MILPRPFGCGPELPVLDSGVRDIISKTCERELVSRKYSYKTVKGYIYYNRDFLDFTDKEPSEVNDDDIKDYLLYLAEEKESATATIKNPAAELRGIKIQNLTALVADILYNDV